jgi:AP-1 complex subunit mu
VVEKLNLLVSSNGTVLHSEIIGSVQMKSFLSGERTSPYSTHSFLFIYFSLLSPSLSSLLPSMPLSGMPELKLGLNDKLMFEATGRSQSRSVQCRICRDKDMMWLYAMRWNRIA